MLSFWVQTKFEKETNNRGFSQSIKEFELLIEKRIEDISSYVPVFDLVKVGTAIGDNLGLKNTQVKNFEETEFGKNSEIITTCCSELKNFETRYSSDLDFIKTDISSLAPDIYIICGEAFLDLRKIMIIVDKSESALSEFTSALGYVRLYKTSFVSLTREVDQAFTYDSLGENLVLIGQNLEILKRSGELLNIYSNKVLLNIDENHSIHNFNSKFLGTYAPIIASGFLALIGMIFSFMNLLKYWELI